MSEMQLRRRAGERGGKIARRPSAVAQNGRNALVGQRPVDFRSDVGREMRRQRRAAEQSHGIAHFPGEVLQPFPLRSGNALFAGDENRGAEPAVLQPERIELGMAAHEHDGNLPTARPAQNPADSPRAA